MRTTLPTSILLPLLVPLLAADARADSLDGRGPCVARAGDVDGDGVGDLLVASRDAPREERVWIVSGKDGRRILELRDPAPGFGREVGPAGDWDGDGRLDAWVDARAAAGGPGCASGTRRILSGRDGRILVEFAGSAAFGGTRDLDGDGRVDALLVRCAPDGAARVAVISGQSGSVLVATGEDHGGPKLPGRVEALAWLDDVDADGRAEFASLALGAHASKDGRAAEVLLRSGRDGATRWSCTFPTPGEAAAGRIVRIGDQDQDGVADLVAVVEDACAAVVSGRTGALLGTVPAPRHVLYSWGSALDVVGDLDRDGVEDWILGANESWGDFFDAGLAFVTSGHTRATTISFPGGEDFGLDACGIGDVNGDGTPDVAIGAVRRRGGMTAESREPAVVVHSGRDGSVLWRKRQVDWRAGS